MTALRSTVIDVDLDAIAHNVARLRAKASGKALIAVVKADAYGHGAEVTTRALADAGAEMLAVYTADEAVTLRRSGATSRVLVLGGVSDASEARAAVDHGLDVVVWDEPRASTLAAAARTAGTRARVHVKVDTGLTRLGALPDEAPARYRRIRAMDGLEVEGAMTHFANADVEGDTFTAEQVRRFRAFLDAIGERPRLVHAAASAGVAIGADAACNAVRPGLAVYGLHAAPFLEPTLDLRPALRWTSRIHRVATVPAGTGVGYEHHYRTTREARIATVPVGYGDGLQRAAREAEVLVRGRRARIAKRVAMDMFMVEVTDIDGVAEGDEVVLIGSQGDDRLDAEDLARSCGTINYEIVTALRRRVARRYWRSGRVVATRTLADGVVWA